LTNATAIGAGAVVDANSKIRLGNTLVTVIEGQVDFTFTSDMTKKENFQPVDGEEVLRKLRGLTLTSWNYIGHDPKQFRHYGPMGQEFFAAFGHDAIGTIGSPTTLTASDLAGVLMSAVQAIEKRTVQLREEEDRLQKTVETFKAENAELRARLERLERTTTGYAR
jgi:Chaperone of endosialidase